MEKPDLNELNNIAKLEPQKIDSIAEYYGRELAIGSSPIKTNQIRNIFSSVQSIRTKLTEIKLSNKLNNEEFQKELENLMRDLILLKPKLAYASGREKNVKLLYNLLSKAIFATQNSQKQIKAIENFVSLVEAIVAYHKFYGGKEK